MGTRFFAIILFVCVTIFSVTAQTEDVDDAVLDSLRARIETMPDDTAKLGAVSRFLEMVSDIEVQEKYSHIMLELGRKFNQPVSVMMAMRNLMYVNFCMHNVEETLKRSFELIATAKEYGNIKMEAMGYIYAGNIYSVLMEKAKADEFYHLALKDFEQFGDSVSILNTRYNIAQNYLDYGMYELAKDYYSSSLQMSISMGNLEAESDARFGLGVSDLTQYSKESVVGADIQQLYRARAELQKSYEIAKANNIPYSWMKSATRLASTYTEELENMTARESVRRKVMTDSCRVLLGEAYDIVKKYSSGGDKIHVDMEYARYLIETAGYSKANAFIDSLRALVEQNSADYLGIASEFYNLRSRLHKKYGDYKQALSDVGKSFYWEQESKSEDYAMKAARDASQAEFDERMRKREIEVKQNEVRMEEANKRMAIVAVSVAVVLLLIGILAVQQMRNYKRQKKTSEELAEKNNALEQQKEEILVQNEYLAERQERIEKQNKVITQYNEEINDSINYASLIQRAAMPTDEMMKGLFGDMLIYYSPLKVVSGDFYWATKVGTRKMLVVADCTGHGVPGAFLSILGISLLNSISSRPEVNGMSAAEVLDELKLEFKTSLRQSGNLNDNRDGMDMGLLIFEEGSTDVQYAGAFRPMIIVRDGNIIKNDADRMPIGAHYNEQERFTNHVIELKRGDVLYMFSDGMTDQFGYDEKREMHKFTAKRFYRLLLDSQELTFENQKARIAQTMEDWRRGDDGELYEQTDDAILLGVRIG